MNYAIIYFLTRKKEQKKKTRKNKNNERDCLLPMVQSTITKIQ